LVDDGCHDGLANAQEAVVAAALALGPRDPDDASKREE
jgi:hypothetical protein